MTNPCEIGFDCPYRAHSDEDKDICTHPYIPGYHDESETFGFVDEGGCPLVDYDSDMDFLLRLCLKDFKIDRAELIRLIQENNIYGVKWTANSI